MIAGLAKLRYVKKSDVENWGSLKGKGFKLKPRMVFTDIRISKGTLSVKPGKNPNSKNYEVEVSIPASVTTNYCFLERDEYVFVAITKEGEYVLLPSKICKAIVSVKSESGEGVSDFVGSVIAISGVQFGDFVNIKDYFKPQSSTILIDRGADISKFVFVRSGIRGEYSNGIFDFYAEAAVVSLILGEMFIEGMGELGWFSPRAGRYRMSLVNNEGISPHTIRIAVRLGTAWYERMVDFTSGYDIVFDTNTMEGWSFVSGNLTTRVLSQVEFLHCSTTSIEKGSKYVSVKNILFEYLGA